MITKIINVICVFLLFIALTLFLTEEMFCIEHRNYTLNHLEGVREFEIVNESCYTLEEYLDIKDDIKQKNLEEIRNAQYEKDNIILDLNMEKYIND